ncbi:MAG: murein biosynthesis integral membrane protein MurJ [Chloroflexi bacterium]|nr:murein biosynthesis integral membrane protein MurJ [Chloroflexota bacterium]
MEREASLPSPLPAAPELGGIARAATVIAAGSVVSRALGLVRETVKAHLFGAGAQVDALNIALIVPLQFYELVTGGLVNSALVPVFSDYAEHDRAGLWRLASVLLSLAAAALSALLLVFELLAAPLAGLLNDSGDPASLALTARLLRITLPGVIFLSFSGILTGLLYALKRFSVPAFMPAAFNASMVALALLLARPLEVGAMALGLLAGAVAQVALQLPALRDARLRPLLSFRHAGLRRVFKLYLPIVFGLLVTQVQVFVGLRLASQTGAGGVSWMGYATTLMQFPLGLVAYAVSLAVLPTLSRHAGISGDQNPSEFKATLVHGLNLVLMLIIPATVGLFVLARPIAGLLFERGQFTASDTAQTALVLRYFLPGLSFAAMDTLLIFAFYARKDTLTPALVGVASVGIYLLAALSLIRPLGLFSLMVADSLKQIFHALVSGALLAPRVEGFRRTGLWASAGKALAAAALLGLAAEAGRGWVEGWGLPGGLLGYGIAVGGPGLLGTGVYFGVLYLLGAPELHLLVASARARLRPGYIIRSMDQKTDARRSLPPELYTESYFLTACEGFEDFRETGGERLSRRLAASFAHAAVAPGMTVLDVGCGRGEILRHCARLGATAFGVDYAPVAVNLSRQILGAAPGGRVGLGQADARRLPFPAESFDRVLMFDVVEHLYPAQPARAERGRQRGGARERAERPEPVARAAPGRLSGREGLAG